MSTAGSSRSAENHTDLRGSRGGCRDGRRTRGLSLLEAVVALALAGVLLAGAASAVHGAARLLAAAREADAALTAARNLLEAGLADPCSPPAGCPDGLRCRVLREPLGGGITRLTAAVTDEAAPATGAGTKPERAQLSLLVDAGACP